MKNEFLQDIKHEIKNPLYVISLGVDFTNVFIDEKDKRPEVNAALAVVQNEALRVGRMINGMVELATMSGSAMIREKTDFSAMLKACAETLRLPIEKKDNTLHIEISPGLPPVYAEADQLERVPVNLLTNAMEATRGGEITLETSLEKNIITVRIRDTGEGIAPELLPRVFERGVSGKGGKGYGLSICRTIVEAHGGELKIESEPGKGTAVTFTIPVYSGQDEARKDGL
jgi:signal transduction histidine kinase